MTKLDISILTSPKFKKHLARYQSRGSNIRYFQNYWPMIKKLRFEGKPRSFIIDKLNNEHGFIITQMQLFNLEKQNNELISDMNFDLDGLYDLASRLTY